MKSERPSRTAEYTALLRALGDIGMTSASGFSDPCAEKMLPAFFACLHKAARFVSLFGAGGILRYQFGPVVDLLAMRTLAIDQIVLSAVNDRAVKTEQIVILGAGLDSRAFRLHGLADTNIFEVDHPASQQYKRAQTAGLKPLTRSLKFVAVDFERDSLEQKLLEAGFNPKHSSVWIWEGVVMYLSDEAMRSTLAAIARLSPAGSHVAIEYREPTTGNDFWQRYMNALLRRCGEPQIGLRTEESMRLELESAGFKVISDDGMVDWCQKFKGRRPSSFAEPARCIVGRI
ncbi:MAG TPA: SAM-dependent methyltransferase [Oculatellaceae cyanobacterium]